MSSLGRREADFYGWQRRQGLTHSTALSYRRHARLFETYLRETPSPIEDWPPWLLEDFAQWLQSERGLAPKSCRAAAFGAQRYLQYLRKREGQHIPRLPLPSHGRPPARPRRYLTETGRRTLIEALDQGCPNRIRRTALTLMPFCGLRFRELCAMRAEDLRRDGRWLTLRVREGSSPRTAYLLPEAEGYLLGYWKSPERAAIPSPWLFPNRDGKQLRTRRLRAELHKMHEEGKLKGIGSRVLAATYAARLTSYGVPDEVIGALAGHGWAWGPGVTRAVIRKALRVVPGAS